jgi:hypothetical protein
MFPVFIPSRGHEVHTGFWWRDLREEDHLEYLVGDRWEDNNKLDLTKVGLGGGGHGLD